MNEATEMRDAMATPATLEVVIFFDPAETETGIFASPRGRLAMALLYRAPLPWALVGGWPGWRGISHDGLTRADVDQLVRDLGAVGVAATVESGEIPTHH